MVSGPGRAKNGKQSLGWCNGGWNSRLHRVGAVVRMAIALCVLPHNPHHAAVGRIEMMQTVPL